MLFGETKWKIPRTDKEVLIKLLWVISWEFRTLFWEIISREKKFKLNFNQVLVTPEGFEFNMFLSELWSITSSINDFTKKSDK